MTFHKVYSAFIPRTSVDQ